MSGWFGARMALPAALAAVAGLGWLSLRQRPEEAPPGKTVLRYMAWGNPQQFALEQRLVDEFNRDNPDLHVRLLRVPGSSYLNKMIVMLASRTAPDVLRVDHYNFPSLVRKDYFRRLDDLVAKDPDFRLDDFFPQAIEEGRYQGGLYGLNVLFGAILIYYNKDLVRAAGLEDPFQVWRRGAWDWTTFRRYARAMTTRRPDGKYATFGATIPGLPAYFAPVWAFGGDVMDAEGKRTLLDSPQAAKAFGLWYELRYRDHAAPTPAQAANSVFSFESGKMGMVFDWMGMTPRFREAANGFDWDCVPIPAGPVGAQSMVKGNQLVMNAETRHPDAAWRFMKYMVSERVERLLGIEKRRTFPTRKSVAYSKAYLESDQPPRNMRAFTFAVETGRPLPITSRWSEWTGPFNSAVDNLFLGNVSDVGAALADGQRRAERALAVPEGF